MKRFLIVAVLAALTGAAAVWLLGSNGAIEWLGITNTGGDTDTPGTLGGDDDRPPVVVSGGSVIIEQQVDGKDNKRGNFFEKEGGKPLIWIAGHSSTQKPKHATVIIDNSPTLLPECAPTEVHKNVKSLTFSYELGGIKSFSAAIVDEQLQFDFPVAPTASNTALYRLEITGATLLSVTVGPTTCGLVPRGRVEIRQRNK